MLKPAEESFEPSLELRPKGDRKGVYACLEIPSGAPIVTLQGTPLKCPTRYSIQITATHHLDESGLIDGHIDHACNANSFVDSSDPVRPVIRAIRRIPQWSEITINYCASEDEITEPFRCDCRAEDCYGLVRGYRQLSPQQRLALLDQVSPYLLAKYGRPELLLLRR